MRVSWMILLFSFLLLMQCKGKLERLDLDADQLAMMQCSAKAMREEAFALNEQMMAVADSMAKKLDPSRLKEGVKLSADWEAKKELMIHRRAVQAQLITTFLDSLHHTSYKDVESRKRLDKALEEAFKKRCP